MSSIDITINTTGQFQSTADFSQLWGSFHCMKYRQGKKCDLCSHMTETSTIESFYFQKKFRIHGHLAHDVIPEGKVRWFIYAIQDLPCSKIIIGSTQNPVKRWSCHKSTCNQPCYSNSTGLAKHFTQGRGCPSDPGRQKETLNFTLVDHLDTTAVSYTHLTLPTKRIV